VKLTPWSDPDPRDLPEARDPASSQAMLDAARDGMRLRMREALQRAGETHPSESLAWVVDAEGASLVHSDDVGTREVLAFFPPVEPVAHEPPTGAGQASAVTLSSHPSAPAVLVTVQGEADIVLAEQLRQGVEQALVGTLPHVVVDLTGLRIVDAAGLGEVAAVLGKTRVGRSTLTVVAHERLRWLLRVAGCTVAIVETLNEAPAHDHPRWRTVVAWVRRAARS
jgi:anti-anti-sigma factor